MRKENGTLKIITAIAIIILSASVCFAECGIVEIGMNRLEIVKAFGGFPHDSGIASDGSEFMAYRDCNVIIYLIDDKVISIRKIRET